MSKARSLGAFTQVVNSYWKGLTLCIAAVAWLFASVTPKFGFITKLTFSSFLVRTYWPEILVVLALLGGGIALLSLLKLNPAKLPSDSKSAVRRVSGVVRQLPLSDRIYGLVVILLALSISIPLLWKQTSVMLEAEHTFVVIRLMNWFGDDLHRIAARQINEGNYETAVRTLNIQAKELGDDVQEGRTAESTASSLEIRISSVATTKQRVLDRMKRAGVTRSDLLMLGVLHAMLPPHARGSEPPASLPGAEAVQAYLAALQRVKVMCDAGRFDTATPQDVGMSAAALGFARQPALLFGRADDLSKRLQVLCQILGPRSATEVSALHHAAFSVSAPSERLDWRVPVEGAATTPGVMVMRSFGRAIDTVFEHTIGKAPITKRMPSMERELPSYEVPLPVLESAVISTAPEAEETEDSSEAFEPVVLIESSTQHSLNAHARVYRRKEGVSLTLCIPSMVSAGFDGYALQMRQDGRLQITDTDECGKDVSEADAVRQVDESLLSATAKFIALNDSGRAIGAPQGMRSSLCRLLVAGAKVRAPTLTSSAITLCPVDAAASGLTANPAESPR